MKFKSSFYLSLRPLIMEDRKGFGYFLYDKKTNRAMLDFVYSSITLSGPKLAINSLALKPGEAVEVKEKKPLRKYTLSEDLPPGQLPLKHDIVKYKGFDNMLKHVDALYSYYPHVCYTLISEGSKRAPKEDEAYLTCFRLEDVGPPETKGIEGVWCILQDGRARYYSFVFSEIVKPFDTDGFVFKGNHMLNHILDYLRHAKTKEKARLKKPPDKPDKPHRHGAPSTTTTTTVFVNNTSSVTNTTVTIDVPTIYRYGTGTG